MALNIGYLTAKTDKASDEVFTLRYAVEPLRKYICGDTIWCPFDKEDSEYVKCLREWGYKVIATHIDNGENFFCYEPQELYDMIISNPPFSVKNAVLKRLTEIGKPYAMLLPIPTLQGQTRFPYIRNCQVLIFDKRINYYTDPEKKAVQKGVSFGSCYICYNFLPKDLIFEELEVPK